MRYYKQIDGTGKLLAIGTGRSGIEITESEYNTLLAEIRAKASWVSKVYANPSLINQVPAEWQEEIQQRVDERKQQEQESQQEQVSDAELAQMIEGVM